MEGLSSVLKYTRTSEESVGTFNKERDNGDHERDNEDLNGVRVDTNVNVEFEAITTQPTTSATATTEPEILTPTQVLATATADLEIITLAQALL